MSESVTGTPLPGGWRGFATRAGLAALRASLKVSDRPMVWVIRRFFAKNGAELVASFAAQAPADVAAVRNERYEDHPDAILDVYSPRAGTQANSRLPTVVWTHGGGWVGGSKDEIEYYLKMIADAGFTVVAVNYALAPGARYPTPVRQVMAALRHLEANADRLHADPNQLMLAGDSAGAHITAQVAAIATNPRYRDQVGVKSTITPARLRAVGLCCGPYDLTLIDPNSPLKDFLLAMAWAYSGTRDWQHNDYFMSTMTVTSHVTKAFPPAFLTVGNADPLVSHSHALESALKSNGVEVETLFFPDDHEPPLGHEYQLDLNLDEGRTALQHLIRFFQRHADTG